jgi:hypothetical protein
MADLNALIAQGAQFQAPPDPFVQYGRMQQLEQGQQANQLNRMKMDEYQRGLQEQNALRGLDPAAADYLAQVKKVNPKLGFEFEKAANEAANLKLTGTKTQADIAEGKRKLLDASLRNMASNPSDENIIAHTQDYALNPLFKDELASIQANAQRLLAMTPEQRKAVLSGAGATAGDLSTAESARLGRLTTERGQDIGATTAYRGQDIGAATATRGQDIGAATATRGQDIGAATAKAGQQVTLQGQNLVNAREAQNIAIRQEDQRRAADFEFQRQMSLAKTLGQDMAKNQVLREAQLPKVLDTAAQTIAEVDALIGKRDANGVLLKGQKPHPGFANAVGAGFPLRYIPGTSESDFQTRFDQIKGGAFLQAFETLKGGGSITNVEGEKGTAALNRMNLAQSEPEFVQAAREFQGIVRTGMDRAKKLAGKSSGGGTPPPPPGFKPD